MALSGTKSTFERLVEPLADRQPFGPNTLTALGIFLMSLAAYFVVTRIYALAVAFVILSGFFDVLDGTLAKMRGRANARGAFFDRIADRIADALIFGSVIIAGVVQTWLGVAVLALVLLGSYASACLESATRTRIGETLSMRAVRLIVLAIGLSTVQFYDVMDYIFAIVGIFALLAFVQRFVLGWKTLK